MSKIDTIAARLAGLFPKFAETALIEESSEAIILDHKGQSYLARLSEDKTTITTGGQETEIDRDDSKFFYLRDIKKIIFLPIDGKGGLLGFGTSNCDAVVFDEADFCFIEFKLNASSLEKVMDNRVKAIRQLENTINVFDKALDNDYEGLQPEAYVCTPVFYPRNNAEWKSLSVLFLENNGLPVFETNEKVCK